MQLVWIALLEGAAAVLAFDVIASVASRNLGFSYKKAAPGSLVVWAASGFLAATATTTNQIPWSIAAGALVGAVDCTLGWYLSWLIGPGRIQRKLTPDLFIRVSRRVITRAIICAAIGGSAYYLLRLHR